MDTVWLSFLTGLTTGGLSCLAVQGGLLTAAMAPDGRHVSTVDVRSRFGFITIFLLSKLFVHMLLGAALGGLGAFFVLSPKMLGTFQIIVGLYMLATLARLLEIHPWFRYIVVQPPRWVYRLLKTQSAKEQGMITSVCMGALTVLMPCGITQATMAIAVASGSALSGALIMGAFIIGTSPLFFMLGAGVVELFSRRRFVYVASGVIGVFAIYSINGGLGLRGSVYTIQNFYRAATVDIESLSQAEAPPRLSADGYQEVNMRVVDTGYRSSSRVLRVNVPVRVTLATDQVRGCARAFTVPDYGISKILPETGEEVVEFTPKKTGRLAYSCSMGMYTGEFMVIN
jgi:uncharacterized protein